MKKNTSENIDINIFHSLFENSISGILYGNPDDGNIYDANEAAAIMFGYSRREFKKLNRSDVFESVHSSMTEYLRIRNVNGSAKGELIGIRKNGERFPIEFTSSIFTIENGESRTSTILNDITERKKAEEEIALFLNNTEESFVYIDKEFKIVYFNKSFSDAYFLNFKKNVVKNESIFDYAIEGREKEATRIFNKILNGECFEDIVEKPLPDGKSLFFHVLYKPAFDFLNNVKGIFISTRDITEQKVIEKEMKLLLDNTEESFVFINKQLQVVSFNKKFESNFQYFFKSDVLKGVSILNFAQEERKGTLEEIYLRVFNGETIETVITAPNKKNILSYFNTIYKPALDNSGDIIGAFVTSRDITEKRKAIYDKEFEQRNREALINATNDLIWSVDKEFKLITANKAFIKTMKEVGGFDLKSGDDLLFGENFDADFIAFWKQMYIRGLAGESFNFETQTQKSYPNIVYLETTIHPIYEGNEVSGISCYSRDITELKNAHKELKTSYNLFEKLTSNIPAAIYLFEISPDGRMSFPYISNGIQKINPNIDIKSLKTDARAAFATVHSDDLEKLFSSIEISKNNLSNWELEYRSIVNDNDVRWMKGKSSPEKKADGTVVWYGYFEDITDQKRSNENIRIAKERYDIISKATNDTIWDWDLKTNNIKWNKGIIGVFGYHLNEVVMNIDWWFGKIHPSDLVRVKENLSLRISKKESRWEDEYRFCCADGTYKYVHDRGFLVIKDLLPIRMIGAMQDITERKKVEEKYFESEFRFKTIFEAEPECVKLVDANGKLMEMNTAGLVMLEAESIDQINAHSLVDFVLPKYRNDYIELHKQVMKGKDGYIEYEALGLKGTKRWMETNAVPIIDINGSVSMMLSVTRDISKRKQEEHHLRLLESVITNTNDSIMITEAEPFDEPGPKIVYVNDAFTKMTGYSKVEVIGKSPRILQGPNSDKNLLNGMGELMRKWKPCEVTVINYKKNGEEFWNNFSIKPIADEIGWYTHWIAVERDITQQKNNDLEREQIISELSQNNKDLKQFSYVTSHNLRAPIANLLGLTSLIDQYKIPNKSLKQIIDGIKQSAIMFDDTVKDLTKVLIIKDQTNVIKEDVSLVTVINNVLKQLSISVDDNDIKINYELNNAPFVNFTTTYMESVFLNLFTNSIKYKSPLRKLKIDISSSNFNDYIELKFKDNGIGIDIDKHKEKIFKLYQRFHDNPDGKGLGLYLIKSQIEALGGTIRVESIVGKETMFVMKFKK